MAAADSVELSFPGMRAWVYHVFSRSHEYFPLLLKPGCPRWLCQFTSLLSDHINILLVHILGANGIVLFHTHTSQTQTHLHMHTHTSQTHTYTNCTKSHCFTFAFSSCSNNGLKHFIFSYYVFSTSTETACRSVCMSSILVKSNIPVKEIRFSSIRKLKAWPTIWTTFSSHHLKATSRLPLPSSSSGQVETCGLWPSESLPGDQAWLWPHMHPALLRLPHSSGHNGFLPKASSCSTQFCLFSEPHTSFSIPYLTQAHLEPMAFSVTF